MPAAKEVIGGNISVAIRFTSGKMCAAKKGTGRNMSADKKSLGSDNVRSLKVTGGKMSVANRTGA